MKSSNRARASRYAVRAISLAVMLALLSIGTGCSLVNREDSGSGADTTTIGSGESGIAPKDATQSDAALSAVSPEAAPSDSGAERSAASLDAQKQLMIRTANMRMQVKDVDDSVARLRALTKEFDGLVESLQVSSQKDVPIYRPADATGAYDASPLAAYATVRVPQERFDTFLTRVTALGKVLVQSESGQDVTQQHIDLSARLTTLKAEEARLRDFLKSAKNVQEMLAVESELSRVRSEIESLQGQLDYLDKQIALSALTVELVRPTPVVQPAGTDWGFGDALRNGIRGAAAVVTSMITVVISLLPLIALVALIAGIWIMIVRSRRRHKTARESNDSDAAEEEARAGMANANDVSVENEPLTSGNDGE